MTVDLRQLRYFVVVAEEKHITRAAERLGMQQPPLSQRIKAIERELGVQLFHRKARGVELTDAGRVLYTHACAMMAQFEQAIEATRRAARGEQGRLCVGVTPSSPFHPFVPETIRAFRQTYPLVTVTLDERHSDELIEHLRTGRVDVGLIRTPPPDQQGLIISPLLDEELVVALPKDHALARARVSNGEAGRLPLKSLANETFLIQGSQNGLGLFASTIAACHEVGFNPRISQEAPRLASTLNMVAVGMGVSIVPASLQRMQVDGVVYRRLNKSPLLTAPLLLATRRGDPSAVVRNFLALTKERKKTVHARRATNSAGAFS